ncbi:MAG: ABC transporter substrate-binding protein, partial [Klebsiella michiganensis]|nr:ABC transporter substrate-binding protein [Klebsiella michiganensis]
GQALVADAWLMPARSDIPAKRPLLNELKILPTAGDGNSERSAVLSRFNTLFAQ